MLLAVVLGVLAVGGAIGISLMLLDESGEE
jgi:hypothetical protein